jgi:hypothetical protein
MLLLQRVALPSLLLALSLWFVVAMKSHNIQRHQDHPLVCSEIQLAGCPDFSNRNTNL